MTPTQVSGTEAKEYSYILNINKKYIKYDGSQQSYLAIKELFAPFYDVLVREDSDDLILIGELKSFIVKPDQTIHYYPGALNTYSSLAPEIASETQCLFDSQFQNTLDDSYETPILEDDEALLVCNKNENEYRLYSVLTKNKDIVFFLENDLFEYWTKKINLSELLK